jgi:hypothetical protein
MAKLSASELRVNLEHLSNCFDQTDNPVYLLLAFCMAYSQGADIPDWVLAEVHRGFTEYIKFQGRESLDKCLRLQAGKGQTPPYKVFLQSERDNFLAVDMFKLIRLGFSIPQAARLVKGKLAESDWNRTEWEMDDVSEATLVDRYKKRWSKGFKGMLWESEIDKLVDQARESFMQSFPADVLKEVLTQHRRRTDSGGVK